MLSPLFNRSVSRWARYGFSLTVLASLTAMLAGLGSRWGWWHFGAPRGSTTWFRVGSSRAFDEPRCRRDPLELVADSTACSADP